VGEVACLAAVRAVIAEEANVNEIVFNDGRSAFGAEVLVVDRGVFR
jgi:hypothetical protein